MSMMIVMEIQLILFQQQTIVTIKLQRIRAFMLLITFLRQQNDLCLHLGTRFQNNKTDHTTFDFMLFILVRGSHYSQYSSIESC